MVLMFDFALFPDHDSVMHRFPRFFIKGTGSERTGKLHHGTRNEMSPFPCLLLLLVGLLARDIRPGNSGKKAVP
jgi:hypothetical protein